MDAISRHASENTDYTQIFEQDSFDIGFYYPIRYDPQTPHSRDELYIIAAGSGDFVCGNETQSFSVGDILFVPAGVEHRFVNFTYDFATCVVFLR